MRILKYQIPIEDEPRVVVPRDARILTIGLQGGELFLWAEVEDQNAPKCTLKLRLVGTGHEVTIQGIRKYLGTVHQMRFGVAFVWHVYLETIE